MTVTPEIAAASAAIPVSRYPELERLIGKAVCDPQFAAALLSDPAVAIHHSSYEHQLSSEELVLIAAIQGATSVPEFAAKLYQYLHAAPDGSDTIPAQTAD